MPRLTLSGVAWRLAWRHRRQLYGLTKGSVGMVTGGIGNLVLLARGRSPVTSLYVSSIELHIEGGVPSSLCTHLHPYLTLGIKKGRAATAAATAGQSQPPLSQRVQTSTLTRENHCRRGALFHHVFAFGAHPEAGDSLEISLWHSRLFLSPIKIASGRLSLASFGRPALVVPQAQREGSSSTGGGNRHQEMSAWVPLELEPSLVPATQDGDAAAAAALVPAAATVRLKLSAVQPAAAVPIGPAGAAGPGRTSSLPPPTYLPLPPAEIPLAPAPVAASAAAMPAPLPVATAISSAEAAAVVSSGTSSAAERAGAT